MWTGATTFSTALTLALDREVDNYFCFVRFHALFPFFRCFIAMATDGCTTITWNSQSSPAKNNYPLPRQNKNTMCVQTRMTSNLIRAFNQKFQQCLFYCDILFLKCSEQNRESRDCYLVDPWDDILTAGQLQRAILYDGIMAKIATILFYRQC